MPKPYRYTLSASLKPAPQDGRRAGASLACWVASMLLVALGMLGCSTVQTPSVVRAEPYEPTNFSVSRTFLNAEIVRVAVLPPTVPASLRQSHAQVVESLQQVFRSEVTKAKLFEVVWLDPEAMRSQVGLPVLNPDRPYPAHFFTSLNESLQCQAVLLPKLTSMRTISPMMMGWQIQLVDTQTVETIWEINEVFDAGNPSVHAAAVAYFEQQVQAGFRKPSPELVLASPSLYGQYTLDAMLATLPSRK